MIFSRTMTCLSLGALMTVSGASLMPGHALALSELRPTIDSQAEQTPATDLDLLSQSSPLPTPAPAIDRSGSPATPAAPAEQTTTPEAETADEPATTAEIIRDLDTLPAPVKRIRELIVEAAASGDIERLRALTNPGPSQTQVMNAESDDPIEALKSFSGDPDGQEILAILLDILSTGVAHIDAGTPEEAYVWPYFTGKTLASLTPPERVELLRIVTAGDLAGMEETGNYNFYRVGITPDGQWKFFAGGD